MELYNIGYLENKDILENGNINTKSISYKNNNGFGLNKNHDKILLMIQANYCGFCTKAKPAFQNFANNNKNIFCTTIQGDSDKESVQKLMERVNQIDSNFRGYPHYLLFGKNGVKINKPYEEKGRTEKDLFNFVSN